MKTVRLAGCSLAFSVTVLVSGCTVTAGPRDDSGESKPRETFVLPVPKGLREEEPMLDEAQQARKEEADRYVAVVIYHGATIAESIQLPSGDIVDGLERDTLPLPYALPQLPGMLAELGLPSGGEPELTEDEQSPELSALVARATPFNRPTFWPYILGETDATSIEDYLDRYQFGGEL